MTAENGGHFANEVYIEYCIARNEFYANKMGSNCINSVNKLYIYQNYLGLFSLTWVNYNRNIEK